MAQNNRVFVGFAKEDITCRDFLVGQAKNNNSPFEFVDMSVKEPWSSEWKTKCREKIKRCDGFIALISKNTSGADGARWEIKCADEESIPILGIYCYSNDKPATLPAEISGYPVKNWTWPNIENFIDSL